MSTASQRWRQVFDPRTTTTWGGGAFGPGKFDMADRIRMNRWSFDCKCWKPAEDFRATYH